MLSENEQIIKRRVIMLQKGYTLASLGKKLELSNGTICKAIHNKLKNSRAVHESIVYELGVSLAEFFPELYGMDVVAKVNHVNETSRNFEKILSETQQSNQGI